MRRFGVLIASVTMVGAMAGFSGTASASFNGYRCSHFNQTCQENGGGYGFTSHFVNSPAPGTIGFCTEQFAGVVGCI
jgi:hypothetical protein